ncbi:AraC family transcriptional regulator ligand-binding domain-containing protein [Nocardia halotolerans]|uniref:AraC family transcriptional regulator ligand-binding domain-containing protein n=1 Tax=Nocardia halotolerans TaxID=1755878 RepID=A0ABV8VKI9_9NOCA
MLIKALSCAGMDATVFAQRQDLRPEVLADDRCRVSTQSSYSMWEQLITSDLGTVVGIEAATLVPVGHFGVWDYLFVTGENFIGSCGRAFDRVHLISNPGTDTIETIEDGALFTIRYGMTPYAPDVDAAIGIFAQALFLRRAREATGRPVTPVRVTFQYPPSRAHARLVEAFGTANIVYDAPWNSMTFLQDDVRAPLPMSPPGLEHVLLEHADLVYATAKPVLDWLGVFRAALDMAFAQDDAPTLAAVAQRLMMSPRSVQRRLAEHGTTWREEVRTARQDRALELLRDTDLPLETVAARLGYSDARALRRSVNRWLGHPPHALRQS